MMNRLWAMKNRKDKRGFTLIELIIVIAILAVLMMIAIPAMSSYIKDSKERTADSNARTAYSAAMTASSRFTATDTTDSKFMKISDLLALDGDTTYLGKVGDLLGVNFKGEINIAVSTGADAGKVTVSWRENNETGTIVGTYPKP